MDTTPSAEPEAHVTVWTMVRIRIISDLRALLELVEADAAGGRLQGPAAAALAAGPGPHGCLAAATAAAGAAAAIPRLQPLMVCGTAAAAAAAAAALLHCDRGSIIAGDS